jgi:integrase
MYDSELAVVLEASLGLGTYGAGVRLLALTGARRSEVFGMQWAEIDLASKTWTLPAARAKNGSSIRFRYRTQRSQSSKAWEFAKMQTAQLCFNPSRFRE